MATNVAPKINYVKAPDFRIIPVTGVFGGDRAGYIEMQVLTDILKEDEVETVVDRIAQCTLIIPIAQAKSIIPWLADNVSRYETHFGEVKMPPPTQALPTQQLSKLQTSDAVQDIDAIMKILKSIKESINITNSRIDKIEKDSKGDD